MRYLSEGLITGCLFVTLLVAQYPPDTIYSPIYVPTPSLPPFNGSVYDSSTGITVTRVSKYDSAWEWYPRHDYAKIQPWNADMSMYKFYSVAIYDARTHEKIRDLPNIYYSEWSNVDPDIIFSFREDGVIATYNIETEQIDTLLVLEGFDLVKLGPGEGNIDNSDHYVALACKKDTDLVVVVVDLKNRSIVTSKTFAGAWGDGEFPEFVDWVSVSQSGEFVGIMWANSTSESNPFHGHYGVEIYNTTDMVFERRLIGYGDHGDFCYSPSGEEIFVQFYGENGTINSYSLNTGTHTVIHTHPDFGYEDAHLSCRNIRRPGWAYVSTDPEKGGMIVAVKLDGSESVELFGHHYSSACNYTKSPMPVPSPDGKLVMFNSDFGDSLDTELVYVFVASWENGSNVKETQVFWDFLLTSPYLNIRTSSEETVCIFSADGREVLRRGLHPGTSQIRVDFLQSGIYTLQLSREHTLKSFIVVH